MTPDQIESIVQLFRTCVKTIPTNDELIELRLKVSDLEQRIHDLECTAHRHPPGE